MNKINRKHAHTVTELVSARQHQKTGRPSFSARERVGKQQPTQSSVSLPEAEGPTLGWLLHREGREGPRVSYQPFAAACAHTQYRLPGSARWEAARWGVEGGDWGRRKGVREWHINSTGWSTHCVYSTRLDRTRARAAAARLGDRRRRCESSFRALARTRRAGSGDAFMLRGRVHSR